MSDIMKNAIKKTFNGKTDIKTDTNAKDPNRIMSIQKLNILGKYDFKKKCEKFMESAFK